MGKIEYYTTFRWMREELHLAGTELECYAVIYSLSLGDNWYMAGVKNMVQLLERSEPTIISALKNLTDKGLIVKEPVVINNTKRNYYKAKRTFDEQETTLNNLSTPTLNYLSTPTLNNLSGINKINNKEIKEKSISNDIPKKRFKKPTIEEIEEYIKEKNLHFDAEQFFDYYESKEWMVGRNHMKDWKAACRTWEHNRKSQRNKEEQTEEGGIVYPEGMDEYQWTKITFWLCECCSKISGKISPTQFADYKCRCGGDSKLLSEILMEINSFVELHGQVDISEMFNEILKSYKGNE